MSKRKIESSSAGPPQKRSSASTPRDRDPVDALPAPPLPHNPLRYATKLEGTTKLATWNVNGIKSAGSKEKGYALRMYIEAEDPDVLVITEVRHTKDVQTDPDLDWLKARYKHRIWAAPGIRDGQVAVLSKLDPIAPPRFGFPSWAVSDETESKSRCIILEFTNYTHVATYCPNSGENQNRMQRRLLWNQDFQRLMEELVVAKPVIWAADFNAIGYKIDVERPDKVWDRKAGCLPVERDGYIELLKSCDLVDVWRLIHPRAREYTHTGASLSGWRLDGFCVSRPVLPRVKSTEIRHNVHTHFATSSDHWPVALVLEGGL